MTEQESLFHDRVPSVDDRVLTSDELDDLIDTEPSPVRVTFSTQDYSVDGLVKRLDRGSMIVPRFGNGGDSSTMHGFQRGFVWNRAQMDRFIESLLLGYPVPGIFLVKQPEDNKMLVLDGQQRLITLQRFYNGMHDGREFKLAAVGDEFKGLTYGSLDEALQNKLDDSYMQATIVAGDPDHDTDEAVFQIFERLNAGGTQLTAHEIRVALFAGELMNSIEALNGADEWRILFGMPHSKRLRDHELILRVLALYSDAALYSRPLKGFLNDFARNNREVNMAEDDRGCLFLDACALLHAQIGPPVFRRQAGGPLNTAQAEAIMVATMEGKRDDRMVPDVEAKFTELLADTEFDLHTSRATADNEAVSTRLARAREFLLV